MNQELREKKKSIVINMSKARSAMRARCLAVGIFLSVITVTSKQLVDNLKHVWKIRGIVDTHSLGDTRFILEFSEEGDFNHVTRGGPWRYLKDAVLIEALKDSEYPMTVTFRSVPIWAHFKNIPFYLLSKELTRDLGRKLGSLITIDNNSRGDICSKFVRARVLLPTNQALQKWISLIDEVTNEEVVVSVFFERLPNFCFHCGLIGHVIGNCTLPDSKKENNYSADLEVDAIHHNDPWCWFLPESIGQGRRQRSSTLPWRTPNEPATPSAARLPTHQHAIANFVAKEVANLSVQDPAQEVAPTDAQATTHPSNSIDKQI